MNNKHTIWRFVYKLHRYIGLISAIVILMLATTGIALNHTENFQLDSQMIKSDWVLDWYGIEFPEKLKSFATQNHWLTQINQQIYFDQSLLIKNNQKLLGAIETDKYIVTAFSHSILLLSLQGEIIEQSPFNDIEQIGLDQHKRIVIKTSQSLMVSDDDLLSWQPFQNERIMWSQSIDSPDTLTQKLKTHSRSSILPLERVLLDIHSGRFFGTPGVIIVDLCGIFLVILTLSGCAIWIKHKLRSLRHSLKSYKKQP